jgi:Na+/H+-dicarboxylate symporter
MLLNYFGFMNSIISILLLLLLPVLLIRYHEIGQVILRSLSYLIAPLMLSSLIMAPFFIKEKKLLAMLLPYMLIYSLMKIVVVSYLYICYLSGRGIDIKFGPRILRVR